ncbi:histidine phosphatase family protein [Paenibacillus albiflavus]|uniref:Histidine phosphatase family protein n=1 Tax=Paenibacillus albiflavus TaxID=2545760 RepID=A0A4R4E4J7_9BACL|nr:histidine phosphatase family protein [Paenibacillus albiflavus]TCZ71850.1 histidine phosphatase family protein [Paenibacillus albiflavus]
MLELLVVRHGQSVADIENRFEGRADFELTSLGIEQATRAAQFINTYYKPDLIISSPLKRASKTAEFISSACKVELFFEEEIMEWNNGLLAGLPREEGMLKFPLPPGGRKPHDTSAETESFIQFRARAETFLSKLLSQFSDTNQRICIVSHGGFINMLFRSFLRLPVNMETSISSGDTGIHLWRIDRNEREIIFTNYQEHIRDLI